MPSNWLYIDTNFPAFTGEESIEEKVTSIQDYMYLLVEQLRYTLHNLDLGNMNKTAKERWESAITEPIYAKIEDDEERILQLAIDAGALALRISDSEGNITQLQATAEGLQTRVHRERKHDGSAHGSYATLYLRKRKSAVGLRRYHHLRLEAGRSVQLERV